MKQQTAEKTSLIADQIREKAEQAARLVRDNTPDSVRDKTAQAAAQVWGGATRAGQYAVDMTPDPLLEKGGQATAAALRSWSPAPRSSPSCWCVAAAQIAAKTYAAPRTNPTASSASCMVAGVASNQPWKISEGKDDALDATTKTAREGRPCSSLRSRSRSSPWSRPRSTDRTRLQYVI
ncbi:hypothetical protein [Streptomyces virginiae]|uniref:hypothetical protein n=1 Tax=Streptomyces virginiae TaxID=1961 RepID=UPI003652AAD5